MKKIINTLSVINYIVVDFIHFSADLAIQAWIIMLGYLLIFDNWDGKLTESKEEFLIIGIIIALINIVCTVLKHKIIPVVYKNEENFGS